MKKYYYRFKEGISSLIKWVPVIWQDRQWDYHYFYIILHRKVELMEEFFKSDLAITESAKGKSEEMKLVKEALRRLMDGDYLSKETIEYDKKYNNTKLFTFKKVEGKNYSKVVWTADQELQKEFREACERARIKEKEDIEFVFNHVKENIQTWWD